MTDSRTFRVDYYTISKSGAKSRRQQMGNVGMNGMSLGKSDLNVQSWLKTQNPGVDIEILNIEWGV